MSRNDGIHSADDLKLRCVVRVGEDCWLWRGAVDSRGTPKAWFPQFGITSTIGPVIAFLRTGVRPKKAVWLRVCTSPECVNPDHWSKASRSAATLRRPRTNPALHTINVALARRASSKLNDQIVAQIREGQGTLQECADRYGISRSTVDRIRRGVSWKPLSLPSSIFSIAEAA
jgi:hypothetical protein